MGEGDKVFQVRLDSGGVRVRCILKERYDSQGALVLSEVGEQMKSHPPSSEPQGKHHVSILSQAWGNSDKYCLW